MNDRLRPALLPLPHAAAVFAQYQRGNTLFSSPTRTMLAQGRRATLAPCANNELVSGAHALLQQACSPNAPLPCLMGALPFLPDQPAHLFIPDQLSMASGRATILPPQGPPPAGALRSLQMLPEPQVFRHNVAQALQRIAGGELEKVVLARSLRLETRVDLPALLQSLGARNQEGYTFAVDLGTDAGRTLIGASPELLLSRQNLEIVSRPLAGSIPRSNDMHEDQRRAQALLASSKDRREHALVVDAVFAALRPYCRNIEVRLACTLQATPTMWHLGSEVRAELLDPAISSLELALALHPTPAVCGHPMAAARDFIVKHEGFERHLYAGLVGWNDANGDGEWAVTLRCAEVDATHATLYAGAGVVAGSDPALELLETSAKLRTMLVALGLESQISNRIGHQTGNQAGHAIANPVNQPTGNQVGNPIGTSSMQQQEQAA